jgi:hypothetical protein
MGSVPTAPQPGEEAAIVQGPGPVPVYSQPGTGAPVNGATVDVSIAPTSTNLIPGPGWPGNTQET